MKKKYLKALSITTCVIMTVTAISGCGKKVDEKTASGVKELSWLGYPINPLGEEGSLPETMIEERFEFDIKPIFLDSSTYADKKSLILSGGDIPDLIYELDPIHVQQDVDHGVLCEVPYEMIKKYAPTVYKVINEEAPEAWMYSRVDGKNYGIPNISYSNRPVAACWRTDWLENVGINKIPETIEEFHDAMYKFTYNDPDKNGSNDTYGMTGDITNWQMMFTEVFGAYGVLPFNWMEIDGKPVYGGLLPGTKEALKTLAQWYSEGLIHPDFITDLSWTTVSDKFKSGKIGYTNGTGSVYNYSDPNSLPNVMASLYPGAKVESARSGLIGPNDDRFIHYWGKAAHVVSFGAHLEKDQDTLIRMLQMFEEMITDTELYETLKRGKKGESWNFIDESQGYDGGIEFISPYNDKNYAEKECVKLSLENPSFFVPVNPGFEVIKQHSDTKELSQIEEIRNPEFGKTDLFLKPDVLPSSAKYFENLRTKQINLMVQIIKGELAVDEYDTFEKLWETHGGNILTSEAQVMQSEKEKVFDEVGIEK